MNEKYPKSVKLNWFLYQLMGVYGKCSDIYHKIPADVMITTKNDCYVTQSISCWLFSNLFHTRCFWLFYNLGNIVYFAGIFLFSSMFPTRQVFLFIFRFERYCTFSCHLPFGIFALKGLSNIQQMLKWFLTKGFELEVTFFFLRFHEKSSLLGVRF